jgi:integrase
VPGDPPARPHRNRPSAWPAHHRARPGNGRGALRQHRKRQAEERLLVGPRLNDRGLAFTKADGSPIHPNRFSLWFRKRVQTAGLPAIRLHDIRHSYATAGLAAGVPPKVMSERLGHATVAFTLDTYASALPAMDKSAAAVVASLILGADVNG